MFKKYRPLIIAASIGVLLLVIVSLLTVKVKSSDSTIDSNELAVTFDKAKADMSMSDGFTTGTVAEAPKVAAEAVGGSVKVQYSESKSAFKSPVQKIIQNGSMTVETNQFDKAVKAIAEGVKAAGGYIENSQITGVKSEKGNYLENRNASYTLRIPAKRFESYMNQLGNIGVVTSKQSGGEDITSQYYDSQTRLKSMKIKESRLLDILKKAKTLTDVLALETELENTRYQIETLTGNLKNWDNLVSYSTLNVSLVEVTERKALVKKPETMGEKLSKAFSDSLDALVDLSKGLLVLLVALIPFAVILGALAALAVFLVKLARHRAKE